MLQVLGLAVLCVVIVCVVYEVTRIWWSPLPGPELWAGLVGWWPLQDGTNEVVFDIGEYAVWDRELTPDEISTLHDNPWAMCKR